MARKRNLGRTFTGFTAAAALAVAAIFSDESQQAEKKEEPTFDVRILTASLDSSNDFARRPDDTIMTGNPPLPTVVSYPSVIEANSFQPYYPKDAAYLADHTILKDLHADRAIFDDNMRTLILERGLRKDKTPVNIDTIFATESFVNIRFVQRIDDLPDEPVSEYQDLASRKVTIVFSNKDTVIMEQETDQLMEHYGARFTYKAKDHLPGARLDQKYPSLKLDQFQAMTTDINVALKQKKYLEAASMILVNAMTHLSPPREDKRSTPAPETGKKAQFLYAAAIH